MSTPSCLRQCQIEGEIIEVAICIRCRGGCLPDARVSSGWLQGTPTWQVIDDDGNIERWR